MVAYDELSAASPTQLACAAAELGCALAFAVPAGRVSADHYALLEVIGTVIELSDSAAIRNWAPDGVVTFSEDLLEVAATLGADLGLLAPSLTAVRTCRDKAEQRRHWHADGIDRTRFAVAKSWTGVADAIATVGYPCVLKPRRGTGSRNTWRLDSAEAFCALPETIDPDGTGLGWIVEELLVGFGGERLGDYISVETVSDGATTVVLAVTAKLPLASPFREQGGILPAEVSTDVREAAAQLARDAVRSLGLRHTLAHVEIKLTEPQLSLIEVNPRLGGYQENLALLAGGTSLVRIGMEAALGQQIPQRPLAFDSTGWWFAPSAPPAAQVMRSVCGMDEIRSWPEIKRAHLRVADGSPLDWRAGWGQYIALFEGAAPDLDQALDVVDRIAACLDCEYDFNS